MHGNIKKIKDLIDGPQFNGWMILLVESKDDKKKGTKNVYPMQANPIVYSTLMTVFCKENSAILHINANVCQSLVSAFEVDCPICIVGN